jgi:hypothetical protein
MNQLVVVARPKEIRDTTTRATRKSVDVGHTKW